jgi:hypothetical protein
MTPSPLSWLMVIALIALLAPASAARAEPPPGSADIRWRHVGSKDFEREHPGLGFSRRYESASGWVDVYGYDLQRRWQDGLDDPQFDELLAQTINEVAEAGRRGHYKGVQVAPAETTLLSGVPLKQVRFNYKTNDGGVESHLFLTCLNGKIMKIRASLREPVTDSAREAQLAFVAEQIDFFRRTERAAPPPEDGGKRIAVVLNDAFRKKDSSEGAFALAYLLIRARQLDTKDAATAMPGATPKPGFAEELEAYTTLLQMAEELREAREKVPAYWRKMQAVQAAGYLREYLVIHRGHAAPADGEPLQLDAFARWSKKHLRRVNHGEVDDYGSVRIEE